MNPPATVRVLELNRQRNAEDRSTPAYNAAAPVLNFPAVAVDDLSHDPEPESASLSLVAFERIVERFPHRLRDPSSIVRNRDDGIRPTHGDTSSKPAKNIFVDTNQLALAGKLVGATMHEVNNRLEALTNLIFLARTCATSPIQIVEYLDEADSQVRSLGEITSRSLSFIRADIDEKEIDLVDLATAALRLHYLQISKKGVNVRMRSAEVAWARVKRGQIFQVVTNLLLNSIEALPHSGNLHLL